LILSEDTRREEPWFKNSQKSNSVFIIFMDIIKVECGLKISIIISICKLDDGFWIKAEIKASEVLCYARWSSLVSWEYGNRFSKFMLRRLTIRVPSG
jgi:hypothetical protein